KGLAPTEQQPSVAGFLPESGTVPQITGKSISKPGPFFHFFLGIARFSAVLRSPVSFRQRHLRGLTTPRCDWIIDLQWLRRRAFSRGSRMSLDLTTTAPLVIPTRKQRSPRVWLILAAVGTIGVFSAWGLGLVQPSRLWSRTGDTTRTFAV